MRALTTFFLIFSLIFSHLTFAHSINFDADPVITVELDESSFTSSFYFYCAMGVGMVLTFLGLNYLILRKLQRTGIPLSPRDRIGSRSHSFGVQIDR